MPARLFLIIDDIIFRGNTLCSGQRSSDFPRLECVLGHVGGCVRTCMRACASVCEREQRESPRLKAQFLMFSLGFLQRERQAASNRHTHRM